MPAKVGQCTSWSPRRPVSSNLGSVVGCGLPVVQLEWRTKKVSCGDEVVGEAGGAEDGTGDFAAGLGAERGTGSPKTYRPTNLKLPGVRRPP